MPKLFGLPRAALPAVACAAALLCGSTFTNAAVTAVPADCPLPAAAVSYRTVKVDCLDVKLQ